MKGHKAQLEEDIATYDKLYAKNLAYYRSLTRYVIAGKLKLAEERRTTLAALNAKAATGDMAAIEAYSDYADKLAKFERLLDEFESVKLMCIQNAPTLRKAKGDNEALIEQFDIIFLTAVPSWQDNLRFMLAQENTRQASAAIVAVEDFHNDMIRRRADLLSQNSIEVARITQREITETETLEYANKVLIDAMEKVLSIQAEGNRERAQHRLDKARLEQEMKDELLKFARG